MRFTDIIFSDATIRSVVVNQQHLSVEIFDYLDRHLTIVFDNYGAVSFEQDVIGFRIEGMRIEKKQTGLTVNFFDEDNKCFTIETSGLSDIRVDCDSSTNDETGSDENANNNG